MTRLLGDTVIARCRSCGGWMMRAQGCSLCRNENVQIVVENVQK